MARKPVKYYVVDAFAESAFKGNPAAVCLLEEKRNEKWLQAVVAEFNKPVTCFLTRNAESAFPHPRFHLRWFTPAGEVQLCGHATLASAHVLFSTGLANSNTIEFDTLSGILTAKKGADFVKPTNDSKIRINGAAHEINLPTVPINEFNLSVEVSAISKALNGSSLIDIKGTTLGDLFVVLSSGKSVAQLQPRFEDIQKWPVRGIVVSGVAPPESGFDIISRFFYPKLGFDEDQICGSGHCALALYWSRKLAKLDFISYVASSRGGMVKVHLDEQNQRVLLRGKAVTVMEGILLV